jgi:HK97 family phage portal protein
VILATKGGDAALRDASVGAVLAAEGMARGSNTGGTAVTGNTVGGLPAYDRAIGIAAEAVAKRRNLRVFRGEDGDRRRVTTTWQARFFSGQPNERDSWFEIFEATEASLTARNNAVWLKLTDSLARVGAVYVIHPDMCEPRWNKDLGRVEYRVKVDDSSSWSEWLTAANILHFKVGYPVPGAIWAPSPVQRFREQLGAALAKVRFEKNLYDNGILQQVAILLDAKITPEQATKFRDAAQAAAAGVDQSSRFRVFGGGASVETIGLSMADAQFVEAMNFDVEQIARIARVPASLLGGATGAGVRTAPTPEQEESRWFRYGLEPRLGRIEEAVKADPSFFGSSARDYPEFAAAPVRADAKTESDILVHEVQGGVITSTRRARIKGLPPSSEPRRTIPQFTPVGGAPNDGSAPATKEATLMSVPETRSGERASRRGGANQERGGPRRVRHRRRLMDDRGVRRRVRAGDHSLGRPLVSDGRGDRARRVYERSDARHVWRRDRPSELRARDGVSGGGDRRSQPSRIDDGFRSAGRRADAARRRARATFLRPRRPGGPRRAAHGSEDAPRRRQAGFVRVHDCQRGTRCVG